MLVPLDIVRKIDSEERKPVLGAFEELKHVGIEFQYIMIIVEILNLT